MHACTVKGIFKKQWARKSTPGKRCVTKLVEIIALPLDIKLGSDTPFSTVLQSNYAEIKGKKNSRIYNLKIF